MAARSGQDEVRHAREVGRFGGTPAEVRVLRANRRSLEELARENAVEGCVRETFGALVATWQAAHAGDGEVRAVMQRIAVDETRHAALAWAVARWAASQLDEAACERVREAQKEAIRALDRRVWSGAAVSVLTEAGLPTPARARDLLAGMTEALWAA